MTTIDRRCALLLSIIVFAPPAMAAEALPTWAPTEICRQDSSPGQCAAFEARARDAVSGSWGVLPDTTKAACLGEVKAPADRSWRLLGECLDTRTAAALEKHDAIATRSTPGEPVPPPAARAPAAAPAPVPAAAAAPAAAPIPAAAAAPAATTPAATVPAAPVPAAQPAAPPAASTEGVPPPAFQLPASAPPVQ
jgi:hypothetical protein